MLCVQQYVRWCEGWKSSDKDVSGERASVGTKQDRKASRKDVIPRSPPLTERSEADDAVVVTEERDRSLGSLRLPAERRLIVLAPGFALHAVCRDEEEERGLAGLLASLMAWTAAVRD